VNLLLDTHYIIELIDDAPTGLSEPSILEAAQEEGQLFASVVSLWEAGIKQRLGKLPLLHGVNIWPNLLQAVEIKLLSFTPDHFLAPISAEPRNKDPFDRALLSTAAAEGCLLVTRDRHLQAHPLVWRPFLK
jgi:PIN domain nuclease of toxin-antitoxin system